MTDSKEKKKQYQKVYSVKWREENKDKIKEDKHNYYMANAEVSIQKAKEYREANVELVKERKAKYYLDHKEAINKKNAEYKEKNKDEINRIRREKRAKAKLDDG